MRKIIAATFLSLDGIMQAPGGPNEDESGGFRFGGWTFPFFDEELGGAMGTIFGRPFELLLGRKTYDIFAAHFPNAGDHDPEMSALFNGVRKHVASRSQSRFDWQNSHWLGEDVVASLRALKQEEGDDLLVQGSSDLLQTLLSEGLVDELTVMIFPVILGSGKRLFGEGARPAGLEFVTSRSFAGGVVLATYRLEGPVKTGSFALPES